VAWWGRIIEAVLVENSLSPRSKLLTGGDASAGLTAIDNHHSIADNGTSSEENSLVILHFQAPKIETLATLKNRISQFILL
jgi:hypothetical protein